MQKYYITNGKEFIKKSGRKYYICKSPVLADTYTVKTAENILRNRLCKAWKETFYLEGVDDFQRIDMSDFDTQVVVTEEDDVDAENKIIKDIDQLATVLIDLDIPSKIKLIACKKELEKSQSFYDRALPDIDHWIMAHNPPAHIRAKVYGIQQNLEQKRKEVKEKYGYVLALIDAYDNDFSLFKLQKQLEQKRYVPYTPNTYVYKMLDDLLEVN
ncbi:hypothetical protein [uncultured Robinsoniella sp.]|uniref:hypothetical protein n=1 Tax=uncultured Robinsoniella sp. TaxID=904190 RepID=UPI00374F1264